MGVDCVSPSRAPHRLFHAARADGLHRARLRELSGGKPGVGFKLCVGHPWEFMCMVKAMLKTGVTPDFIVVDRTEGWHRRGAHRIQRSCGCPRMREGLLFVHNTLVDAGLHARKIKVGVAGKIVSAFDIVSVLATSEADWANAARGFMSAVRLRAVAQLQHQPLPLPASPPRIPLRQKALVVPDKSERCL